ncbi:MAG: UbiA family prenyltransferase, partial [Bacteroidia bacterium]|nr:UbiA family prenyltransferase [Bacteroidia bacterium]
NVLVNMSGASIIVLFAIFFALATLPWFYLPFNRISALLLGSQFLLFFLYAVPPFRLKERGLPGIYADALYAHVIPAVLASYTFYVFTQFWVEDFSDYILVIACWQTIQGIRNILFHQLKDYESDKVSGTRTFVTLIGFEKTQRMVKNLALPLEGFSFVMVLLLLAFIWNHLFLLVFAGVYALFILVSKQKELPKMDYRARAYLFLDDFYIQWLPLIVLGGLVRQSLVYIPVFILHVLLFRNGIKTFALNKAPNFNLKK